MMETITLEQVEKLANQLPPLQQLKLVARICEKLIAKSTIEDMENNKEKLKQRKLKLVESLLTEVDDVEDDTEGEFDAVEDLHLLREERVKQICRSDA